MLCKAEPDRMGFKPGKSCCITQISLLTHTLEKPLISQISKFTLGCTQSAVSALFCCGFFFSFFFLLMTLGCQGLGFQPAAGLRVRPRCCNPAVLSWQNRFYVKRALWTVHVRVGRLWALFGHTAILRQDCGVAPVTNNLTPQSDGYVGSHLTTHLLTYIKSVHVCKVFTIKIRIHAALQRSLLDQKAFCCD